MTLKRGVVLLSMLLVAATAAIIVLSPSHDVNVTFLSTVTNQWGAKTITFLITNGTRQELSLGWAPRVEEKLGENWFERDLNTEPNLERGGLRQSGFVLKPGGTQTVAFTRVAHLPRWRPVVLCNEKPRRYSPWRLKLAGVARNVSAALAERIAPSPEVRAVFGPEMNHGFPAAQ